MIDGLSGDSRHELTRMSYVGTHSEYTPVSSLVAWLDLRVEPINDNYETSASNPLNTSIYGTHLLHAKYNECAIANYDKHIFYASPDEDPETGVTSTVDDAMLGLSAYTMRTDFINDTHQFTTVDRNAMLTHQHLNCLFYSSSSHRTDELLRFQLYGMTSFPTVDAAWRRHFNAPRIIFSFYTLRFLTAAKVSP